MGLRGKGDAFKVLGPLEVTVSGKVVAIPAPKHRSLLAGLLVSADHSAGFDQLARWIWDEELPANPRAALHTYVRRVRQQLGDPALLTTTPFGYRLDISPDQVDLFRFRRLVSAAATADQGDQVGLLRAALGEWSGDPLADVPSERLREEFLFALLEEKQDLLERLYAAELAGGGGAALIPELRAATAANPLREKLWELLMLALYRAGRQAEALDAYQTVRDLLIDGLGVEPGPGLRQLHGRVLAADPGLVDAETPVVAVPAQLPPEPPSLVGRTRLIEQIRCHLGPSGALRVVVLTGTAGIGKTALALHVGHRVRENYPDGQLYVNLGGYDKDEPLTPERAMHHLLTGLGVPAGQIPFDLRDQVGMYRSSLADKRVLVVLDNASEKYEIDHFLPGASGCALLVTSRDRFHRLIVSNGAQIIPLDTLDADESAGLVTEMLSVRAAEVDRRIVAEVAELCGHLPLALRIAAANLLIREASDHAAYVDELRQGNRLAALSLGDGGDTGVTAAFSLSYRALSPVDQRVFRYIGLLPGRDFSASALAVLTGVDQRSISAALNRLTSASLVQRSAGDRYEVHDLLRQYAAELFAADGADHERQAIERLGTWYMHVADRAAGLLHAEFLRMPLPPAGTVQVTGFQDAQAAFGWLNAERQNLIATALRSVHSGPGMVAWHLADILRGYFWTGKYRAEWREITEAALQAAEEAGDKLATAAMHRSLGNLYNLSGAYQISLEHQGHCLRLHRELGMAEEELATLINIGHTNLNLARPDEVRRYSREALIIADRVGSDRGKATALVLLGSASRLDGAMTDAMDYFERSLALATSLGLRHVEASSIRGLGLVYQEIGDARTARQYFERALRESEWLGSSYDQSNALYGLALTHSELGDPVAALEFAGLARDSFRKAGERTHEVDTLCLMASVLNDDGRREEALACAQEAHAVAVEIDYQPGRSFALLRLAWVNLCRGDVHSARDQAKAALELVELFRWQGPAGTQLSELAEIHARLGDEPTAIRCAERAIEMCDETGQNRPRARAMAVLEALAPVLTRHATRNRFQRCLGVSGTPFRGIFHVGEHRTAGVAFQRTQPGRRCDRQPVRVLRLAVLPGAVGRHRAAVLPEGRPRVEPAGGARDLRGRVRVPTGRRRVVRRAGGPVRTALGAVGVHGAHGYRQSDHRGGSHPHEGGGAGPGAAVARTGVAGHVRRR